MEYTTRPVNLTAEEINKEIDEMYYELYRYGRSIDRCRLWDLQAELERQTGSKWGISQNNKKG